MRTEEAQIIAKVIGIVATVSAQLAIANNARAMVTNPESWDSTIARAKDARDQAIEHLGTMLAKSCYGAGEAIDINKEIIDRLERIVNDQKTIHSSSQSDS